MAWRELVGIARLVLKEASCCCCSCSMLEILIGSDWIGEEQTTIVRAHRGGRSAVGDE